MPETKRCIRCGNEFSPGDYPTAILNWPRQKYCGDKCRKAAKAAKERARMTPQQKERRRELARRAKRAKSAAKTYPPKKCLVCGDTYHCGDSPNERSVWGRRKYCSDDCTRQAWVNSRRGARTKEAASRKPARKPEPAAPVVAIPESLSERLGEPLVRAIEESFRIHPDFAMVFMRPEEDLMSLAWPGVYSARMSESLKRVDKSD